MADGVSQVLKIWQLARGGGIREVCRELVQLSCGGRVAAGLRGLGGALQIGGYFLRDLRVFGGIGLLKLLERAGQLRERRELAAIGLLDRCKSARGSGARGGVVGKEINGQDRVQHGAGETSNGTHAV